MLKSYNKFIDKLGKAGVMKESAPKIPLSEDYWKNKGKIGKEVMLYFHDDLDGIYSAIAMKNYLEGKGFEMAGYGIVNYQEGWTGTKISNKYINIALDYAENTEGIDVYMDHHGHFIEGENEGRAAIKTATGSAYEGIMDQLGLPIDAMILNVIDMVDSAKYDDYNIDIKNILEFDPEIRKGKFKNKLEFAAAFNQLLKRSDHRTFIEVVANSKDKAPSIYSIFSLFKILYPANNLNGNELKKVAKQFGFETDDGKPDVDKLVDYLKEQEPKSMRGFEKDFLKDAYWRLGQVKRRTRGTDQVGPKNYIDSLEKFKKMFVVLGKGQKNYKVSMPGYQIIGNMCFVPSGTWANAIRARAILEVDLLHDDRIPIIDYKILKDSPLHSELSTKDGQTVELVGDIDTFQSKIREYTTFSPQQDVTDKPEIEGIKGVISVNEQGQVSFKAKQPIFWILLQYGNTLQVASLHKFDLYVKKYLPKVDGEPVKDLGAYCNDLLMKMVVDFGYNVKTVTKEITKSGGHKGIGSISNIFGDVEADDSLIAVPDPTNPKKKLELSDKATELRREYEGARFLDMFKNRIINELSGIEDFTDWAMPWGDPDEKPKPRPKDDEMNKKVMMKDDIRKAQDVKKQYAEWDAEDDAERIARFKQLLDTMGVDGVAKNWGITPEEVKELAKKDGLL